MQILSFKSLVDTVWLAHGGVEDDGADALPALLEEGDNEVGAKHDVLVKLALGHCAVTDWDTEGNRLLQTDVSSALNFLSNSRNGGVLDVGWELVGTGVCLTEGTVDLTDDIVGGDEAVVLGGPLLDSLLLLVESLESWEIVRWKVELLSLLAVDLVTKNTDYKAWADDVWKLDGANETLVFVDVVRLKADLKLNSLNEFALLGLGGVLKKISNGLVEGLLVKMGHRQKRLAMTIF